jgi:hypothetical protein
MSPAPIFLYGKPSDKDIVKILKHHYGDGVVYMPENTPWSLYSFARKHGYISEEGYVTRKGRDLLCEFDGLKS